MLREATINDIPTIQVIRNSVTENQLSNPNLVTDAAVAEYLTVRGKGWVALHNERIVGFGIISLQDASIWALFLHPQYEAKGLGSALLQQMLQWYFAQTTQELWLSTDKNTRAETFYKNKGWQVAGDYGKTEVKLTLTYTQWKNK